MFFSSFINLLLDFLFPKSSEVLHLESLSSGELLHILPPAEEIKEEDTIALFNYHDPLMRDIIWELKYKGNRTLAKKMAEILYDVLLTELAERALTENFVNPLLIPVPMADKKKNERGYNQTEILCDEVKKLDTENRFKLLKGQLVKHRHTVSQTTTATKKERLENLKESMHIIYEESVRGRSVFLLDDVTTTGATFAEAKRALRKAGVKKIVCLALAH